MRACLLTAPEHLEIHHLPDPEPGPREILLRVEAVGICGTDFHIWSGAANYNLDHGGRPIPLDEQPQVLGHEIVGEVVAAGPEADIQLGQRVVVDQGRNCRSEGRDPPCEYCRSGASHQCDFYREHGISGLPGGMAEYLAVPALNAVPAADTEPARAALVEPLACVLHAVDMLREAGGRYRLDALDADCRVRTILVCGGGPGGLFFVQVLRRVLGFPGRIVVSEPDARKRATAATLGAETVNPLATPLFQALKELTGGRQAELVVEATGSGPLFLEIPGLLRKQGTLILYGHGHAGVGLGALNGIQWREPTLVSPIGASGGFDADGRPAVYRRALELIREGVVDLEPIITHRYQGLEELPRAFREHRQPGYIKGVALL